MRILPILIHFIMLLGLVVPVWAERSAQHGDTQSPTTLQSVQDQALGGETSCAALRDNGLYNAAGAPHPVCLYLAEITSEPPAQPGAQTALPEAGATVLPDAPKAAGGSTTTLPPGLPPYVAAFANAADAALRYRSITLPAPAPKPGRQPDIRMTLLASAPDLLSLAETSPDLSPALEAAIGRFCRYVFGCSLRDAGTAATLTPIIGGLGLPEPVDFSFKFFAPHRISSDRGEVFCELDDAANLYLFRPEDDAFVLSGVVALGLPAIFPANAPANYVLTGCDMDDQGQVYVAISENVFSGSDGVALKFAPGLAQLSWISPHGTANSGLHWVEGRLFSAHGGTGVTDYLFELDPETGAVLGRDKMQTAVEAIFSDRGRLVLAGYDFGRVYALK